MQKGFLNTKANILKINFTKDGNFKEFNNSVKQYLLKKKYNDLTLIIDYIYPIVRLENDFYEVKDHINLSGFNPLKGPCFIALNDIYKSKTGIIVAGLKEGIYPNNIEKKKLLKLKVKAYCYSLVPTVIFAVSLGVKIKAFGVLQQANQFLP